MVNSVFEWCVHMLVYWADVLGITYKAINVWIFVIIWPILTIILIAIIIRQRQIIQDFQNKL